MGSCSSTIRSLQILKVSEDSISHKNGVLPFIHSIVGFNGRVVESKEDALAMNKEWEAGSLHLELIDMRTLETTVLEIPKKDKTRLGISVKFHQSVASLLSMEVLRVSPGTPAEKAGIVVGDYVLGIENIYSRDEEDLLRFLDLNRRRTVPLAVYNNELEYVRICHVEVGIDTLLGCQIGTGELYKVPCGQRRGRIEFNSEIVRADIRRLRRKQRGRDIVSSRLRDVVCGSEMHSESMSSMYGWEIQEKTPLYEFQCSGQQPSDEGGAPDAPSDSRSLGIPLLDVEDVNGIPVIHPEGFTYEVPVDDDRCAETEQGDKPKDIVSILEDAQEDHFDFESNLSLVGKSEAQQEDLPRPSPMPEDVENGGAGTFLLPIEKSHSHGMEFDAKGLLSSLSLSLYGTENGHDSDGHKDGKVDVCPLCFERHPDESNVHIGAGELEKEMKLPDGGDHVFEECGDKRERAEGREPVVRACDGKGRGLPRWNRISRPTIRQGASLYRKPEEEDT